MAKLSRVVHYAPLVFPWPMHYRQVLSFEVAGNLPRKSNQRRIAKVKAKGGGTRPIIIKSKNALAFEQSFLSQVPEVCRKGLGSEAAGVGANAYLVKPFTGEQLKPAIELALANFEKSKELEAKLQQMNEALEARKLIERAKGILMRQTEMDEEAAYLKLQKTARNENRKLVEVARAVIMAEQLRRDTSKPAATRDHGRS